MFHFKKSHIPYPLPGRLVKLCASMVSCKQIQVADILDVVVKQLRLMGFVCRSEKTPT